MRRFAVAIGLLATLMETSVHAADIPVKVPQPLPQAAWNWSGFYIGVGGSLNWADFNQSLQGVSGVTNVMLGQTLVAQGQAGGPSSTSTGTDLASRRISNSATSPLLAMAPGWPGSNSPTNTRTTTQSRT